VCPSHLRRYTSTSPVVQHDGPMVAVGIAGAGKQPVVKAVLLAARTGDQARRFTSRSPVSKKSPSVKGVNRGAFGQTAKNLRGSDRGGNRPKKNSYLSYIAATTKCAGNDVNILPFVVIPFQEAKNHVFRKVSPRQDRLYDARESVDRGRSSGHH